LRPGQESIEVAQQFPSARVLAVDLSLASLAYAERKAREMRVDNVDHAQADLSKLGSLGRRFDIIYSVGVLHHLADPMRGWRELVSLLAADGRMLVGLYSERSRRMSPPPGRSLPNADMLPPHRTRRCRRDLMSFDREAPFSACLRADFVTGGAATPVPRSGASVHIARDPQEP
jgi:SAM-dependent methyltransferase